MSVVRSRCLSSPAVLEHEITEFTDFYNHCALGSGEKYITKYLHHNVKTLPKKIVFKL